ncbi:MAG TPA: CpsD/CapB family tyrosine-protein kinase, partial [Candidatus Ozemobacteraceae bacterium]|nr:CpsD/CapB family tyrosine-protein kinase [Candidatus Ozemobacteraceae bacterium]
VAVRVISEPIEPVNPNRPTYSRYMIFSILIGLLAGGLLAYLQENFDNSLKSTDDAQQCLGLVNLGSLPDLKHLLNVPTDPKVEIAPALVTFHHRSSPEAEAFRTLRTTLLYKAQQHPFKTLILTSWGRNMGKSTVTANIAMTYAQSGMKVILVDCDMHKPTLHHLFFLQNHRGLTDLIMGDHLEKVLKPTAQPNLFVIPTGPLPPNPSELLGSQSMDVAIRLLSASADLVIFDMPPLMAVADSAVLAGKVEAVLFLVPIGKESRRYALKGLDLLRLVKAPIVGMVCNFLKRHEFEGYRYHYHV